MSDPVEPLLGLEWLAAQRQGRERAAAQPFVAPDVQRLRRLLPAGELKRYASC